MDSFAPKTGKPNLMGMKKESAPPTPQIAKFRKLARALECDDDEAAFKAKLRTIARARPAGKWEVREIKDGSGFYPHLTPSGYAPEQNGPDFPTVAEARTWIIEQMQLAKVGGK